MKSKPFLRYPALIILIFLFGHPAAAQNGIWSPKILSTYGAAYDISFTDSLYGWAVGDTGRILHTSNGGQTWTSQVSNTVNNLFAVSFINRTQGFAAGDLGTFLKTTNGGMTWTVSSTTPAVPWQRIHFSSTQTGWMISNQAPSIYQTTDGGTTWNAVGPAVTWTMYDHVDMWFNGGTSGWVAGGSTLLHTSDGQIWSSINTYYFTLLSAVSFPTDSMGYVVKAFLSPTSSHDTSIVYKTTDAGQTWNPVGSFSNTYGSSLYFTSPAEGWFGGDIVAYPGYGLISGAVWHTTNGGGTWTQEGLFDSANSYSSVRRLTFTDRIHGWCSASSFSTDPSRMMIAKYFGVPLSVHDRQSTVPDGFVLDQNYPNPFNPSTTIRYKVPASGHVRLTVFDVTGGEIARLVDGERYAGTYTATWSAGGVASGMYYARLEWNGFTLTRKMLLVR